MENGNQFENITVEDLIANDRFLHWVKYPTKELDDYWTAKFAQYPEAKQAAEEARKLISETTFKETLPPVGRQAALLERIKEEAGIETPSKSKELPMRRWLQIAASLSIVALIGVWLYNRNSSKPTGGLADSPQLVQAAEKGRLFLSDGRVLSLEDLAVGTTMRSEESTLVLTQENHLTYQHGEGSTALQVDSILSPLGQVYQVDLPDGSRMWLNSGTKVRMAEAFSGEARRVSVSGQAYFEVARNENVPFTVTFDQGEVTVLGTQFDVMTYPGNPTEVTLLAGSVRITDKHNTQAMLKPGEQAKYSEQDGKFTVSEADTTMAIAWRKGVIAFKNSTVEEVMKQISRWYGLSVEYEGTHPSKRISGTVPASLSITEVLVVLNDIDGDASFRATADKIIVSTSK